MEYHLAQVNVARMLASTDDPVMAEFMANLEPVNALADSAPGFIWRLQMPDGNATSLQVFDDALIIVNMSVWTSLEMLKTYVYKSRHVDFMRRRKEWFEKFAGAYYALWWVPAGYIPDVAEAKERLESRHKNGDTAFAFSFQDVHRLSHVETAL